LSPVQKVLQCTLAFLKVGVGDWAASHDDYIPTRFYDRNERPYSLPYPAFGTIAFYSISHRASSSDGNSGFVAVISVCYQHKKRVGIGLSQPPHPLDII